ncbi:unnamed protein product [Vitrella brassicaformis CCMP3155]|uniref:Uncharacterized protein n=1 Tax=Vitrella brassicaformis (strain CCMP3155) TaxID=1169540 RepID=A0A0G4FI29_VITBC|nr:unnamed protein product [Vitrella brassicaformis CCMP3155]|eukprot:CEM13149.1 unnamed protein product [Vitrella brassicaformis CCMP3155]
MTHRDPDGYSVWFRWSNVYPWRSFNLVLREKPNTVGDLRRRLLRWYSHLYKSTSEIEFFGRAGEPCRTQDHRGVPRRNRNHQGAANRHETKRVQRATRPACSSSRCHSFHHVQSSGRLLSRSGSGGRRRKSRGRRRCLFKTDD